MRVSQQNQNKQLETQMNIRKQAILFAYQQNQSIDELRKKCARVKSGWEHLPHQDIHYKLDKLEKNFLTLKAKQIGKQNQQKSESLILLEMKMNRRPCISAQLQDKLMSFMQTCANLQYENTRKAEQINAMRQQLNGKVKKTEGLCREKQQQQRKVLKIECENKYKGYSEQKIKQKFNLIFNDS